MGLLIAEANILTLFICDLFHDGVGSETPQRRTLRWLVNVEGSSQISFEILSHHFLRGTEGKTTKTQS
jgi:hypothetical protein